MTLVDCKYPKTLDGTWQTFGLENTIKKSKFFMMTLAYRYFLLIFWAQVREAGCLLVLWRRCYTEKKKQRLRILFPRKFECNLLESPSLIPGPI